MVVKVDSRRCPQNHRCPMVRSCPKGAITQDGFGLPKIDQSKCIECLICVERCPLNAMVSK